MQTHITNCQNIDYIQSKIGIHTLRCLSVQWTVEKRQIGSGCRLAWQVGRDQGSGSYWGLGIGQREVVILGTNMGRPIQTNGGLSTIGNAQCAVAVLHRAISAGESAWTVGASAGLPRSVPSRPSNGGISPRSRGQTCFRLHYNDHGTGKRCVLYYCE